MTEDKESKSTNEFRVTIIDTLGPMIAQLLKESKKNRQDINEMKTILKRLTN
jgi:hypothetical protein